MIPYDPAKWYWTVAGDGTQVYSSAVAGYVPIRDATYVAWVGAGGTATKIGSEQELWDYLNGRVLDGTPPTATSTDAAKEQRIKEQLTDAAWQVLFSHQNQLLTLQGQSTITRDQFMTRVKGLIK